MCLPATEIMLSAAAVFFFCWSLRSNLEVKSLQRVAPMWGIAAFLAALMTLGAEGSMFKGVIQFDAFSQFVKLLLAGGFAVTLMMSRGLQDVEERHRPEYYLFLSTATLGMVLLVGATDLITLYVALELSSYSLYLLIPLRRNSGAGLESGIKYLLLGVASSGIMVYGLSLVFGLTQTTRLSELALALPGLVHVPMFWVASFLTLVPILFKLSLAPFHFWAPDVYTGGNTQTIAYIASVSKIAALAVLIRFIMLVAPSEAVMVQVWTAIAVASMTLGNLAAFSQQDVKRLMGYSSVAQAGYLLLGCLCQSERGLGSAMFYAAAYLIMTLAAFLVITCMAPDGRNLQIRDFRGLSSRSPLLALTMMVCLFSLAGVPPLAGFTGKWFLFSTAVLEGHRFLAIIAILNSVASLYYYLGIVREAYTAPAENEGSTPIRLDVPTRILCWAAILVLFVIGFLPGILMPLAERSVAVFFQ